MSDDDLRDLLGDAVADVEPRDRLGEIRRRTARPVHHRRWPLAVLAAGTATAAVVVTVAVLGGLGVDRDEGEPATDPGTRSAAVATYFTGDDGRLYREFQSVPAGDREAITLSALRRLEQDAGPRDPDYSTAWPDGSFLDVAVTDDVIVVRVGDDARAPLESPGSIEGLVDTAASLQQVVYTAQAAVRAVVPIRFEPDGVVADLVLGDPVDPLLRRDSAVAAAVNISDPAEGHEVDDLLTVRGFVGPSAGAPETVGWELRDADGSPVLAGRAPVEGSAWEETTDISRVPPGRYEVVVSVSGGEDGPSSDTRTVVVR